MTKEFNLKEVQRVNEVVQNTDPQTLATSPQQCYEVAIWCATQKAYTGEQMSIAKKMWSDKKVKAYHNFIFNEDANKGRTDKYGVNVIKDYINARCGDMEAAYEYVERTNNALGHLEGVLRTVISSLKEEMKSAGYD